MLALDKTAQRVHQRLNQFATRKYQATVRLIDQVTEPGSRINNLLKRLADKVFNITTKLNDTAFAGIRKIEASLARIAGRTYTIAVNLKDSVSGKIRGLTDGFLAGAGVMGAGLAGVGGVGYGAFSALSSYIDFEKNLSRVQAVGQLSKDSPEMKAITEQVKQVGATTAWTRSDAAQAAYYMKMAGWDSESVVKALPSVANLASAGGTDLKTTSDILTDTMTGLGLKTGEYYVDKLGNAVEVSQHYADIIASTITSANTDIVGLGNALKYSGSIVGSMYAGKDIQTRMQATEDAMIMTGLMANSGIKDTQAGTATRAIFSRFGSENRNAAYALNALDVDFVDENHEVRRIGDVMRDLSKRFKEGIDPNKLLDFAEAIEGQKIHADTRRKLESFMDSVQKNGGKMTGADALKMSSMLAGQEAMSGLLAVMMGDWDELAEKIQNAHGAAEKMKNIQLDNLDGSLKLLAAEWDAFTQDLFEGDAGQGIRNFVDTLTEIVGRAQKLFSDGIQIGDIGKIIGDVIDRLKNKFLEFDGIGSVLAGGALFAGLMKIGTTVQKIITYFKELKALEIGARLGSNPPPTSSGRGISAGQAVNTMNVTAGVVNINGKVSGSPGNVGGRKVGDTRIIDNYNRTKEQIRGTSIPPVSRFAGMRSAGLGGAAFAGIFAGLDFMNTRATSEERVAEAQEELAIAKKDYEEQLQHGASQDVLNAQAKRIAEAQENIPKVMRENREAEFKAGAGAAGSIAGTAIGSAIGSLAGPVGTVIGGIVGGLVGEKLGEFVADKKIEHDGKVKPESPESNFFGIKRETPKGNYFAPKPKEPDLKLDSSARRRQDDLDEQARRPFENLRGLDSSRRRRLDEQEQVGQYHEQMDKVLGQTGQGVHFAQNVAAYDFYSEQREQMQNIPTFDFANLSESVSAELESISEKFSGFAESVGEIFSGIGTSFTEIFSGAFEGIGDIFASIGESIITGLSSVVEVGGEIFSGFGELVSSGMESATSIATSALDMITNAFSTAKEMIQGAWSELPGFFDGVFSGLGSAAESAGSAIYSGLTSMIGAVIGAWESASATVSGIISSIASAASSVASMIPSIGGGVGKAEGGFVAAETHFFAGEHGPEVVIPLSSSRRARALDLFEKTAAILGGEAINFGSDEMESDYPELSDDISFPSRNLPEIANDTPISFTPSSSSSNEISMGGINISFSITGAESPQEVLETIKENLAEITDKIAAQLSVKIGDIHQNQNLSV